MSLVGNIYIDATTNKKYECTAVISISPTLINDRISTHGVYKHLVAGSGETVEIEPKTIILLDDEGNEYVAVLVDGEIDFTATPNDIREGMIAATDDGVTVGEKFIPSYIVTEGAWLIPSGSNFSVPMVTNGLYDYTKFQAIICPFNTSMANSVKCEKVVINDNVYDVLSTESLCEIKSNSEKQSIDLGFDNTFNSPYLIRFFTYKEVY